MKTTSTTSVSPTLNRSIFFFYEKTLRYVPILLMLCHWYGVYSFHDNPREILIDIRENEECIAYLYFMVYIFPVVFMLRVIMPHQHRIVAPPQLLYVHLHFLRNVVRYVEPHLIPVPQLRLHLRVPRVVCSKSLVHVSFHLMLPVLCLLQHHLSVEHRTLCQVIHRTDDNIVQASTGRSLHPSSVS